MRKYNVNDEIHMIDPIINTKEYNSFSTGLAASTKSTMCGSPAVRDELYPTFEIKIIYG